MAAAMHLQDLGDDLLGHRLLQPTVDSALAGLDLATRPRWVSAILLIRVIIVS